MILDIFHKMAIFKCVCDAGGCLERGHVVLEQLTYNLNKLTSNIGI